MMGYWSDLGVDYTVECTDWESDCSEAEADENMVGHQYEFVCASYVTLDEDFAYDP